MLDNPFPVPFPFNVKNISVYFTLNSMKISCKQLISMKAMFFRVIPSVLGRSINLNIATEFYLDYECFQTIFPFLVTLMKHKIKISTSSSFHIALMITSLDYFQQQLKSIISVHASHIRYQQTKLKICRKFLTIQKRVQF